MKILNMSQFKFLTTLFLNAAIFSTGFALTAQADDQKPQPIVQTNIPQVLGAGAETAYGAQTQLNPGLYFVSKLGQEEAEYWLVVDNYVNDPDKTLAIMIPASFAKNSVGPSRGWIMQGRPIKGGSVVMLSPLVIDIRGNVRVLSETQSDAPVIEVQLMDGKHRQPFELKPRNGALAEAFGSEVYGMRAAESVNPHLKKKPSSGKYEKVNPSEPSFPQVSIWGKEVSLPDADSIDHVFHFSPLNGAGGKFAGLSNSKLDTMAEEEIASIKLSGIAVFMDRMLGTEVVIVAKPGYAQSDFHLSFYKLSSKKLMDTWFPGRTSPRTKTE